MSSLPSLHAHHRLVSTPFGLLGAGENALTFAFAYTMQQCPALLQWFLKQVGIPGMRRSNLANVRIDLQRSQGSNSGEGITDIEIHLPGRFHVIVEAKVGLSVPSIEQCCRYLPRFKTANEPVQRLVAMVQSPDLPFLSEYARQDAGLADRLCLFEWSQLLAQCIHLMLGKTIPPGGAREWLHSFWTFLDQEYGVKAFNTEVWVVPIENSKPLWQNGKTFWKLHQKYKLYFDHNQTTVRPLYLAFRVDGRVEAIRRVTRTEYSMSITDLVPEFKHIDAEWVRSPNTVWHFGPAVTLPQPLSTGAGLFARRIRADLDLLLTCETVQQLEAAMGKRRRGERE